MIASCLNFYCGRKFQILQFQPFLNVQWYVVNYLHILGQYISETFPPCQIKSLHPLNKKFSFFLLTRPSNNHFTSYFWEFDYFILIIPMESFSIGSYLFVSYFSYHSVLKFQPRCGVQQDFCLIFIICFWGIVLLFSPAWPQNTVLSQFCCWNFRYVPHLACLLCFQAT
jgi:hypothetical protein